MGLVADKIEWQEISLRSTHKLSNEDFRVMCQLHSKYFNHRYNEPCTCNKSTLRNWIEQLNNKLK
jgi:hypothetical protein